MTELVTMERDGHVLRIGVNRPEKANAWNAEVISGVAEALAELRDDGSLRVGLVFGHGKHFTAGLDLMEVAPVVAEGRGAELVPPGAPDPWGIFGDPCPKPVVVATQGRCNTLGIEFILNAQVAVAADNTVFAQLEVARGILPLGGATFRLPLLLGGAGMRYLLTAEDLHATEALRIGLVQEVVPLGSQIERGAELAHRIASNAPLGVQASLANARLALDPVRQAAADDLVPAIARVMASADAMEGATAMFEQRPPSFAGE